MTRQERQERRKAKNDGPQRLWSAELISAWLRAPRSCCYASLCQPCAIYHQRVELLAFTGEPSSCCVRQSLPRAAGCGCEEYVPPPVQPPDVWPPREGAEPQVMTECQTAICLEASICPCIAVRCTRHLMQHKWGIKDSKCTCLTVCGLSLAGPHFMPVLTACLAVQQQVEFEIEQSKRTALSQGIGGSGPAHQTMESPVQHFQMQ